MWERCKKLVENPGIDPGTSRMLSERSTIWANSPARSEQVARKVANPQTRPSWPNLRVMMYYSNWVGPSGSLRNQQVRWHKTVYYSNRRLWMEVSTCWLGYDNCYIQTSNDSIVAVCVMRKHFIYCGAAPYSYHVCDVHVTLHQPLFYSCKLSCLTTKRPGTVYHTCGLLKGKLNIYYRLSGLKS